MVVAPGEGHVEAAGEEVEAPAGTQSSSFLQRSWTHSWMLTMQGWTPAKQLSKSTQVTGPRSLANQLEGGPGSFAGCCSATTRTCGVMIDTTSIGGPYFGCTDVGAGGGGPQKCGSSSGSCSVCAHAQCSVELNACTSNQQCTQILSCVSACTEQACVDKCVGGYPAGKPTFYGFMTCVEQKCQTECQ